jgi:N-acetylmuramoyl-L-alanine amidase
VSVHVNAGPPTLAGLETYHWPGDAVGAGVALAIQRATPAPLRRRGRRPRSTAAPRGPDTSWLERPRAVLHPHASRGIPCVLVELGYRTAPDDLAALRCPAVQMGLASALDSGLAEAMRLVG